MLELYFAPGSSSMAAHIALHEVGAEFKAHPLSLATKDTRTAEYLSKINPEGKVPTLFIDGRRLTEVAGILFYLAKRYPAARLLPVGDIEAEAQAVSWMSFLASSVHPARAKGEEHAKEIWTLVEKRLGGRPWALGDAYSVADIHMFRLFWRFGRSLQPAPGAFPGLEAHYGRMMERAAVRKVLEIEAKLGVNLPA